MNNYNGGYSVHGGRTYYGGSSSGSDSAQTVFSETEQDVISLCWDNPEWFEDATLEHIKIIPKTDRIVLEFKPIDAEDARALAMGIQHLLPYLKKAPGDRSKYTWNKFEHITTEFGN